MKRIIILAALATLAGCFAAFFAGRTDDKVWHYTLCDTLQLESRSGRIEVRIEGGSLLVADEGSDSLMSFMRCLHRHPERRLWLTVENLTEENKADFTNALRDALNEADVATEQLVVESDQWDLMFKLNQQGVCCATTLKADGPRQLGEHATDSVVTRLSRVVGSGCVSVLIVPGPWYGTLRHVFADESVDFLIAAPQTPEWRFRMPRRRRLLKDGRLRAIAI